MCFCFEPVERPPCWICCCYCENLTSSRQVGNTFFMFVFYINRQLVFYFGNYFLFTNNTKTALWRKLATLQLQASWQRFKLLLYIIWSLRDAAPFFWSGNTGDLRRFNTFFFACCCRWQIWWAAATFARTFCSGRECRAAETETGNCAHNKQQRRQLFLLLLSL